MGWGMGVIVKLKFDVPFEQCLMVVFVVGVW